MSSDRAQSCNVNEPRASARAAFPFHHHPAIAGDHGTIAMRTPAGVCCIAAFVLLIAGCAQTTQPARDYLKASPRDMQWFREVRLGMFVCWGPVSLTGKEIGWSRAGERRGTGGTGTTPVDVYDNLYKHFNPERFDAREWVRIARDAGAKYMIFLVKHHDGFCLYDTKLTDYKSTGPESAWKVDVLKQVADACHEADLKLIVYYSQPDWHHPDYRTENHGRYIRHFHGQIREILTNYGRIDGLWFDGLMARGEERQQGKYEGAEIWDAKSLFRMARSIQPHIIINNRCGLPADFDTPEQKIGQFQTDRPWESCITLGTQWSWKPDDKIKSLKECIDILVRCAGGDGNLALNTNPMPDGRIEPRQADRFREIGRWLAQYGQSIYGTRGGPFLPGEWGASTRRDRTIYLHILKWEQDTLTLPPIAGRITGTSCLTGGTAHIQRTPTGITVSVPSADRDGLDTIVALDIDHPVIHDTP